MRVARSVGGLLLVATLLVATSSCRRPAELTRGDVEEMIRRQMFSSEPTYAEVPQRVEYGPDSPMDDYDELAVRTLANLEAAELVTVGVAQNPDGTTVHHATVTPKGFRILGTVPSARGPAFRGLIAERRIDGVRDFVRHPNDPTVGRAVVDWHYANPTWLYPLFETKIDKPIGEPFVSVLSLNWKGGAWQARTIVAKARPEEVE